MGSRKRLLIGATVILVAIVAAGVIFWRLQLSKQPLILDPEQQRVQDTSQALEGFAEGDTGASDAERAITRGNLALSYAFIGECVKAHAALKEAQSLAPANLKDGMSKTEKSVKEHCK